MRDPGGVGTNAVGSVSAATRRRWARLGAAAGVAAALLFVGVFLIEGWLRPGYSATGMFVSELSLGPRGWVQIASFVLTGLLIVVFARGVAVVLEGGVAGASGPLLLQVIGVALIASGPFVTDPSAMFSQRSVHGIVHGVFGAVVFSLAPVSSLVLHRRFRRDPDWGSLAGWTLAVTVSMLVEIVLLKVAEQPSSSLFAWKGLIQRVILISYFGWIVTVALRLRRLTAAARGAAGGD